MRELSRRDLLRIAALSAAGAFSSACRSVLDVATGTPSGVLTPIATIESSERDPIETSHPRASTTPSPTPTSRLTGTATATYPPFEFASDVTVTRTEDFYAYTYHPQPPPDIRDFRLKIYGHVRNELDLTLDDLMAMPMIEEMRTLECISNPVGGKLISNAVWRGVPTAYLLGLAGVLPRALELKFECADGYHTSVPVKLALDEHSFLAYWMNGTLLPAKHGYPVRALWPGRYGQKQPKWITGIELIDKPHLGHWERQGWSNEAIIVPNSRIDAPKKQDVVRLPIVISGIGFANQSGVERIEISTDDGVIWTDAALVRGPSKLVWTEWHHEWVGASAGSHVIRARVTDGEGRTQRSGNNRLLGGIKPDGTDLQHAVAVTVKGS